MKKLLIHPGSPKTATSTIQGILNQNRQSLENQGIGIILPQELRDHSFLANYISAYRGRRSKNISEISYNFYKPYLDKYHTVIISEETFCHDFMPSMKFGDGGIDRAKEAAELLAQNPFDKTEIVLTVRPQLELLTSTYTHFVHRHREQRSFYEWLHSEVDMDKLLWEPAIQEFRAQFSPESVKVIPMDAARDGGFGQYVRLILDALGLASIPSKVSSNSIYNPSPSWRAVELCTMLNKTIMAPQKSLAVNSTIVRNFPVSEFGKFSPNFRIPVELKRLYSTDYARVVGKSPMPIPAPRKKKQWPFPSFASRA